MNHEPTLPEETLNELPPPSTELYYPSEAEQAQTGFTKSIVDNIIIHMVLGTNLTDAANIVKLPVARVFAWYKNNYCNFAYSVDYARADHKRRLLKHLVEGKDATKIRASQFLLERKYRDEYGKEIKIEVNQTMVENITRVVFDKAVKYITDPEKLKLFIEEVGESMALIRPNEGMPENQKLIS